MSYTLLNSRAYDTSQLCLIDCGDGSTVELLFPLEASEEQILQGASLYREQRAVLEAERAAAEAELKAKIDGE